MHQAPLKKDAGCFAAGYNHGSRAEILAQYQVGRPIQWGAFTSVTTVRKQNTKRNAILCNAIRSFYHDRLMTNIVEFELKSIHVRKKLRNQKSNGFFFPQDKSAAKEFAPDTRVIFKITVTSGRDINAYSFFPQVRNRQGGKGLF